MIKCKKCIRNKNKEECKFKVLDDKNNCLNFKLNIHYKWSEKENQAFLKRLGVN